MKKIIFRKLLGDCLIFSLITLLGISLIIWIFQAVNFLDIIIEDGRNYKIYIYYSLLNFPKIVGKVWPFSLFFSFSYILIKYEMNNELIIFWNHGVKKITVINFFLILSFLLLILQFILLTTIVPKSEEIAREKLRTSDADYFVALIKPKKFNDTLKGLTIYAEEKSSEKEFKNLYIKKTTKNSFQITYAKKGVFELKGDKQILVLHKGQTLNSNNGKITNFSFKKSDYNLGEMNTHLIVHKKLQEQSTKELIRCVKNIYLKENKRILNCDGSNPRNVYRELFERLITPLYIPLLILISSINILFPKENAKYLRFRFLIFLTGFVTIVVSESSKGYMDKILLKNIFLVSLPIILTLILYSLIFYNIKIKSIKSKT